MRLLFDLETDGLLSTPWDLKADGGVSTIHCMVAIDIDKQKVWRFRPGETKKMLALLDRADVLIGHNIATYDLPVLHKLLGWMPRPDVDLLDTIVWSRYTYPGWRLTNLDKALGVPWSFQKHSLEQWGYRLGNEKGDFGKKDNAWEVFTEEMLDYCEQDVRVNYQLISYLEQKSGSPMGSAILESNFQAIMYRQRLNGVRLNVEGAIDLAAEITDARQPYIDQLREAFPPWQAANGQPVTPKRSMNRKVNAAKEGVPMQIKEGCPYTKLKWVEFNPNSGDHIIRGLKKLHGWEPTEFTDKGKPSTKRDIMKDLPWEEAQWYAKAEELGKKVGLVSDGKQGWLKQQKDGVIHGRVKGEGTVTGRCSHSNPNLGQVPKVGKPYGAECRALFGPTREGWVMVGCDAAALEARMQAHFMYRHDGGRFRDTVLNGDIHTLYQKAAGMFYRDNAKTVHYAFLYGAGDAKLGTIILFDWNMAFDNGLTEEKPPKLTAAKARELGKKCKAALLGNIEGLKKLKKALKESLKADGYITSIDGRRIYLTSEHSALNFLLQGTGAVLMKKALVLADRRFRELGFTPGVDYEFMLNVHDEWQLECREEISNDLASYSETAIRLAGEFFNLRCPHKGEAQIGANWKETH